MTLEHGEKLVLEYIGEYQAQVGFLRDFTKSWDWGMLFYIQSKEFIETGENPVTGLSPLLVDKIDQSIHSIDYLKLLDKELEIYRHQKGYPKSIKFPVKGDLSLMEPLEKVLALMRTEELSQINEALEIVKQQHLFNIEEFGKLLLNERGTSIPEAIARNINSMKGEYVLFQSKVKKLPKEIALFKNSLTSLFIGYSQVVEIPDEILKLKNLRHIDVIDTPLVKLPFNLKKLVKLESIELTGTGIKARDFNRFILPENCKLKIE